MDDPGRHASYGDPSFDGLPIDVSSSWNDRSDPSLSIWPVASTLASASAPDAVARGIHSNAGTIEGISISPSHASRLQDKVHIAANSNAPGDTRPGSQADLGQLGPPSAQYIQTVTPDFSWAASQLVLSNLVSTMDNTVGWMSSSIVDPSGPPHSAGPVQGPVELPPHVSFEQPIMELDLPGSFPFSFTIPSQPVTDAMRQPPVDVESAPLSSDVEAIFSVKPEPAWARELNSIGSIPSPSVALPLQYSPTPTPTLAPAPPSDRHVSSRSAASRPRSGSRENSPRDSPSLEIILVQPNTRPAEASRKRPATEPAASRTLKRISCEDANGEIHGAMITLGFGQPEHHRSRFSPEKRAETNLARKEGVCTRCRDSKRKCDLAMKESLYVACTRCSTSKRYKGISPMPCFRSTLNDIMFFRPGPAANEPLFTNRFKRLAIDDISKPNVPVRSIQLTQRVGTHKLTVYASEFVPLPNDKVSLKWKNKDGSLQEKKMPAFCLTNMQKVTAQIERYIHDAKRTYLEDLLQGEELVSMTVRMAVAYSRACKNSLVDMALDLWAISRMIEIEWEMCGPDTLGVERFSDPLNPRHGKIPIPPMMDTQLDQIVILRVLNPLREKLLNQLEARISPFKREDWFDIYLTSFIVLNHIERLARHSAYHAELHCMSTKFSNIDFLISVFHSAKVVLSRFHFVCNGSAPLGLDWDSPASATLARLNPDQAAFMKKTQALIRARETRLVQLRAHHDYGVPLYWSSQLFTESWDNSPARVIEGPQLPRVIEVG